jgi:hypothetical protein
MYSSYSLLSLVLDWGQAVSCHALAVLYPWERIPGTQWIGGWVAFRAGLDTETKNPLHLPRIEPQLFSLQSDTILTDPPCTSANAKQPQKLIQCH